MTQTATPERILLVEDDASLRRVVAEVLDVYGYEVLTSPNGARALEVLQSEPVDLVITDLAMPELRGEELLARIRSSFPAIPVIAVTAFGSVENAVELTRAGAADYLVKPFRTQALLDTVARVLEESRPQRELARLRRGEGEHLQGIIGRSRLMQQLFQRIGQVASSPAPILITGETGSGKERVAEAIHRASGRHPFVPVNCGAIPTNLLESELFGYVRGAFTGAERDKAGLFEVAHDGTLFLDEIAELPLALQPKLLRVLQSSELRRVGDVQNRQIDTRVIAATHRDLRKRVQEQEFREDLFFRINVLQVDVPPLRARPTDIPFLTEHFLTQLAERERMVEKRLTPDALAALVAYSWPGNVRQLMNVVERAALLSEGEEIGLEILPEEIRTAAQRPEIIEAAAERHLTLAELEREYILEILRRFAGNKTRTAEVLGIPRRSLYRRLEEYGIQAEAEGTLEPFGEGKWQAQPRSA